MELILNFQEIINTSEHEISFQMHPVVQQVENIVVHSMQIKTSIPVFITHMKDNTLPPNLETLQLSHSGYCMKVRYHWIWRNFIMGNINSLHSFSEQDKTVSEDEWMNEQIVMTSYVLVMASYVSYISWGFNIIVYDWLLRICPFEGLKQLKVLIY